ncbi:MAG: pyroglutamyl-peptidase I [Pseudoxanthomonas sp.]
MSRARNVLITGFEPFGADPSNPSWEAARQLDGETIAGHRVHARRLPVTFRGSRPVLENAIAELRPRLVICTGLSGGRARVSIERVAINVIDARIPDNAGDQPVDAPVQASGPAAYFSTLPIKAMLAALQAEEIPAEISQTAGTYVCNQIFYDLRHLLRRHRSVRAGFIHVPYSPELAAAHPGAPSLPVDVVAQALRTCLDVGLTARADLSLAAGAEQ